MRIRLWRMWRKYGDRLSMRGRIGLGITVSRLIFLPVIFLSIYYIAGMVTATNRIAKVDAKVGQLAGQIAQEVDEMRKAQKNYVLLNDPISLRKIRESSQKITMQIEDGLVRSTAERPRFTEMKELMKSYMASIEEISQSANPRENAAALKQFSGGVESYQKRIDNLVAVAKRSKTRDQVTEAIDEISSAATSFDQIITRWMIASEPERSELLEELQSKGEALSAQARLINESGWQNVEDERARTESLGKRATLLITVTLVLTLLLSFAFTWYLPKRVLHPIREVTQALRKASSGNYDVFLRLNARDELGELVSEFHNLVNHVRHRESSRPQMGMPLQSAKEPSREHNYTVF
ncbi:MAG: HAMP domain-containing protein [Acidobacteria bacterium]|nr:HAMP domain-containing protein [Acidobacteriota bacterium]MCI0723602.1 HAMP domain-containing protein [Acidobacteriota bacterium]